MSHYAEIECAAQQKSEADFIASLESVFGKGKVEVNEGGKALIGYHGDDRSKLSQSDPNYAPKCEIIIRRKTLGAASNDIGYRRNEEGGYTAYISDYDEKATFTEAKRDAAMQEYSAAVATRRLKAQGYTVTRTNEKGHVKLKATKW